MPKEIAIKTKEVYPVGSRSDSFGETYPVRESATSNGAGYKCKKIWVDACLPVGRVAPARP